MQLSSLKIKFCIFLAFILSPIEFTFALEVESKVVPECPYSIIIKNGTVVDAEDWSYSIPNHFIDEKTKKILLKDGKLKSDFNFPEVTEINTYTGTVTGGLSSDDEEETEFMVSYIWDIQKINKHSQAVFYCDFHGDRNETPVQFVYLYKKIPSEIETCTVSYRLENDVRIPESQILKCK